LANILSQNVQVIWQCGKLYLEDYKNTILQMFKYRFIERMDLVYADVVISRAGACLFQSCVLWANQSFYSFSNVAEDHQTKNAKAIVDKKGALMLKESDLMRISALF
jgi:UDP-N-acetylglucosamine--N-acetylmuramyl-(pentapeptide) pyrophosphoryl-undecaprenol N-acetylglucosamine transferase